MTTLPAAGYFTNAARTNAEAKTAQDDMLEVNREQPGGAAEQALTIASGAVTPALGASRAIKLAGEGAADDTLDNVVLTNVPTGALVILRGNGTDEITLNHGAGGSGQMLLRDAVDYLLDTDAKRVACMVVGTDLLEIWRSGDHDLRAEIATTSGTVHTFSAISPNATRLTYTYRDVSHSGGAGATLRLRAGDGTIKTSGYNSAAGAGTEIPLATSIVAGTVAYGRVDFQLMDRAANRWHVASSGSQTSDVLVIEFTLTNPLSDLQLDWSGGETFDLGSAGLEVN